MYTLWLLFVTFLKIGAFTFGGGYAMIPLIAQAITQYQWLNMQEIMDVVAISQPRLYPAWRKDAGRRAVR